MNLDNEKKIARDLLPDADGFVNVYYVGEEEVLARLLPDDADDVVIFHNLSVESDA